MRTESVDITKPTELVTIKGFQILGWLVIVASLILGIASKNLYLFIFYSLSGVVGGMVCFAIKIHLNFLNDIRWRLMSVRERKEEVLERGSSDSKEEDVNFDVSKYQGPLDIEGLKIEIEKRNS